MVVDARVGVVLARLDAERQAALAPQVFEQRVIDELEKPHDDRNMEAERESVLLGDVAHHDEW